MIKQYNFNLIDFFLIPDNESTPMAFSLLAVVALGTFIFLLHICGFHSLFQGAQRQPPEPGLSLVRVLL